MIGAVAVSLGVALGYLLNSVETAELIISILAILVLVLIIVNNPLDGILVWLVLTPFLETRINIPMGAGIPDLEFGRLAVAILAIFMLARAAIGQFSFAQVGLVELAGIATVFGAVLAAPLSTGPKGVLQTAITLHFIPLSLYFFAKNLVQDEGDLHKLFWAATILGSAVAAYAIYEQTTGNILFLQEGQSASDLWVSYTANLRLIRGLLGRASNFGRVLDATIPISFYLLFESKTVTRRVWLVGMLVVQAYGLFLTYNRTSWYALLLGLTIIQFLYPRFRKAYFVIALVAVVVLWAAWDQVSESAVVEERVNSKVSTLEGREARWTAGYNMWRVKPIRGWGFGQYEKQSGRFRTDGARENFVAIENEYLHILVGSGLVGFLPYVLFLLNPLLKSVRLFFRARAPDWPGFIKPETIAIYWAVILSFGIGSYTQIQTQLVVKAIPFAVAGAVVGTQERWLCGSKVRGRSMPAVLPDKALEHG